MASPTDDVNLSKPGTRVLWITFALLLAGGALATFPGNARGTVALLGFAVPWKWVVGGIGMVALCVASAVAVAFDNYWLGRSHATPDDTYSLGD